MLELEDLIEGVVYYTSDGAYRQYIYKYKKFNCSVDSNSGFISINNGKSYYDINTNGCFDDCKRTILRKATAEERCWLNRCIDAKKFVKFDYDIYKTNNNLTYEIC